MLCRALLEQLPPEVAVALLWNPRLTGVELLAAVSGWGSARSTIGHFD